MSENNKQLNEVDLDKVSGGTLAPADNKLDWLIDSTQKPSEDKSNNEKKE